MIKNTEFGWVGWCNDDNHDKVWGYFYRPTDITANIRGNPTKSHGWNCCIFWGRRGKVMQFKSDITGYDLDKLVRTKMKKGYIQISSTKLDTIWPSFEEEMRLKLSFEVLAGRVK